MKNLLLFYLLMPFLTIAQFDDDLSNSDWEIGTEKIMSDHKILRKEGANINGFITNIRYKSCEQVQAGFKKMAEDNMWTEDKLKSVNEVAKVKAKGGQVTLYIARPTIESANTKFFTIIIKEGEKEIYRETLQSKTASVPIESSEQWTNLTTVSIPVELKSNPTIYVIDALGGDNKKYVFVIK